MTQVFKFGGVAVGSVDAVNIAAQHVKRGGRGVAAVVSAANGITDLLLDAGQAALRGDRARSAAAATAFEQRYVELAARLLPKRTRELRATIAESTQELRAMCESIAVLRELTPRASDAVVARGERVLARIFTTVLQEQGIDAVYVDATDVVMTEHKLGSLWPKFSACERAAKKHVVPLLEEGRVVIMPGYIGSGPDGEVVTLGRGGSDFSAAILARSLGAAWKLGYTEPDPRDDLSGTDVARKALILARTLGRRLELGDIALQSLFTAEVDDDTPSRFVDNLGALDDAFANRVARAKHDGNVLRYVAKIGKKISVGIEAVDHASPLGRLKGTDNTVVIHSKRYATNPLVVTGPGAGAAVTAAGVLNDIVAITMHERRSAGRKVAR